MLQAGLQSFRFFTGLFQTQGRVSFNVDAHIARANVFNRLDLAKAGTLRVAVAQVALDHFVVDGVIGHRAERAHRYAGAAADTDLIVHFHAVELCVAGDSTHRAAVHAGGILALLAGHGNVQAFHFPLHDSNPAAGRVGDPVVLYGAYQFAQPAARAFLVIYN